MHSRPLQGTVPSLRKKELGLGRALVGNGGSFRRIRATSIYDQKRVKNKLRQRSKP